MVSDAHLAPSGESKYNCSSSTSYMSIFMRTYKPTKLGQTDLVFGFVIRVHQYVCASRITSPYV